MLDPRLLFVWTDPPPWWSQLIQFVRDPSLVGEPAYHDRITDEVLVQHYFGY